MKILCLCSAGNVRSVGTRMALYVRGHDPIAAGVDVNSKDTINYLSFWAEKILVATHSMGGHVPEQFKDKIDQAFFLGEDRWGNPFDSDLQETIKKELDRIGL